jgi:CTP synthase (UTP-ammonia lyase)
LEEKGLIFSGMSPDGLLPETIEFADTPGLLACSFIPSLNRGHSSRIRSLRALLPPQWSNRGWCDCLYQGMI